MGGVQSKRGGGWVRASVQWSVVVCAGVGLASCSGGGASAGADAGAGATEEPVVVAGADELRSVLAAEGVGAVGPGPAVATTLFELGQALFFDKVLSGNMDVSCATCHWPEFGSADARTLPLGVGGVDVGVDRVGGAVIPRNSPMTLNAHRTDELFWDGRVQRLNGGAIRSPAGTELTAAMLAVFDPQWDLLAVQSLFPPTSREEMRGQVGQNTVADLADDDFTGIWQALRDRVLAYTEYQQMFFAAYPGVASLNDFSIAHIANALAAFQASAFARSDSPFERFVAGDAAALTAAQVAGGLEFYGDAGCARCHSGSNFSDGRFHNIGLPQIGPGKGDGAGGDEDFGRERVTFDSDDRFEFRTPSLHNVALTAPYGHAGQYATLTGIVDHYVDPALRIFQYDVRAEVDDPTVATMEAGNQAEVVATLDNRLRARRNFDVDAVVAFLGALTADSAVDMAGLIPGRVPSGIAVR